jgi:hypothetical protein
MFYGLERGAGEEGRAVPSSLHLPIRRQCARQPAGPLRWQQAQQRLIDRYNFSVRIYFSRFISKSSHVRLLFA